MNSRWWDLPGPRLFLDDLEDDLEGGRNLILCLPRGISLNLKEAVSRRWQAREDRWLFHPALHQEKTPLKALRKYYQIEESVSSLADLPGEAKLRGYVLWQSPNLDEWRRDWAEFSGRYQQACKSSEESDRPRFAWELCGAAAVQELSEDACLAVHTWKGRTSGLDLQLYAALRVAEIGIPACLRRDLLVATSSQLACFDPEVVDSLVEKNCLDEGACVEVLDMIASKRDWSTEMPEIRYLESRPSGEKWQASDEPLWSAGILDEVDGSGRPAAHSAAVRLLGNEEEIRRRLWRAQVGVLLPLIEAERVRIRPRLESRRPGQLFSTRHNGETKLDDLDIGEIAYHLRQRQIRTSGSVHDLVACLHDVRNKLAHLQWVDEHSVAQLERQIDEVR